MARLKATIDGNEAAAHVAYQLNEVVAIYPITPASPMGEFADQWSSEGRTNLWGSVPRVIEMQSEGGAAGVVHGSLQAGALTTTFTASQGLLLMLPNMFKIAGELTPFVMHVAARSLACQALSIFGDHSDVMTARGTGFAMLCSGSVQETMDLAAVAYAASLESRIPVLHFFDGFRTSHELTDVEILEPADLRAMIEERLVHACRQRALSPDRPVLRGAAMNPDVYFQAREAGNPYYRAFPSILQNAMDRFSAIVGRNYRLFDYVGLADAERLVVLMGSGAEATQEAVEKINASGEKVGLLKVRLYRPFDVERFLKAIPPTVRSVAVLDRTKEPGSSGEPLYLDVVAAFQEGSADGTWTRRLPRITGGRYGLSSKEFTPAMAKAVFDELWKDRPRNHFTVGINDDVTHNSLSVDASFSTEPPDVVRAVFFGLGADGTVGANKNSIKIIAEETGLHVQGYFVYDSKKSGSMTISHLRFGPQPIRSTYLVQQAGFVACHHFAFLERVDVLGVAAPGATLLLNAPCPPEEVWGRLPRTVQKQIIDKRLRLFAIDAGRVARELGMGGRINTIMQNCFFALSGVLPRDQAVAAVKRSIEKTYAKRGAAVVEANFAAVDASLTGLVEIPVPASVTSMRDVEPATADDAPEFVRRVTGEMLARRGDDLPVSALPIDGTWPTGTARFEKRNIATHVPVWDEKLCIQCGKCVLVCPHATVRAKLVEPAMLEGSPEGFRSAPARWKGFGDKRFTLQVAVEDCTGCSLCVEACPVKDKASVKRKAINMEPQPPLRESGRAAWDFFEKLPDFDRTQLHHGHVKDLQLLEPRFEFSGACAGCGETPYLKALTQLFGDRAIVANATGCSSIYGGNLPTTPWSVGKDGRGPAWANSLFEDNAEFGLGIRLAVDKQHAYAGELLKRLSDVVGDALAAGLLSADQTTEEGIAAQRERVAALKRKLSSLDTTEAADLLAVADSLVRRSVWIVGGDGWAYDIGFGGLDHVLASGADVNCLVLDTEVYSNTGGQMSKATPRGAVAKFAAGGKRSPKKDLAMMAMTYGSVYVARVAFDADDEQAIRAMREAEAYRGPSLVIAYSHCIAHGYDLVHGLDQQKAAVKTGYWPLLRYDPTAADRAENPLHLDSKSPSLPLEKYIYNETRFSMLAQARPGEARDLLHEAQADVHDRWRLYQYWAAMPAVAAAVDAHPQRNGEGK